MGLAGLHCVSKLKKKKNLWKEIGVVGCESIIESRYLVYVVCLYF